MKDLLKRLTSRKFLLALSAALALAANKQYTELMGVVIAYIGAEGGSDIATRYAAQKYAIPAKVDQQTQLINSGDLELTTEPKVIVPGQP